MHKAAAAAAGSARAEFLLTLSDTFSLPEQANQGTAKLFLFYRERRSQVLKFRTIDYNCRAECHPALIGREAFELGVDCTTASVTPHDGILGRAAYVHVYVRSGK